MRFLTFFMVTVFLFGTVSASELKIKPYNLSGESSGGSTSKNSSSKPSVSGGSVESYRPPASNEGEGFDEEPYHFVPSEKEECDFDYWVGKPVDENALEETGRHWRVLGPRDQITMEYMFGRINLIVENGKVIQVTCG